MRFKQYEQELRKNLTVKQPSGSDLGYVNKNDILRWGITKFSDIKIVCNKIQDLSNKTRNDNNNDVLSVTNEEGAISGGYYK